ncbi:MAG: HIT domain-containing protein [Spirochaetes bacterium]|nr:HIT domain-containing protein [Spirochaetota bacterium]
MLKFNSYIFAFKKKNYIRSEKRKDICPLCCIYEKCQKKIDFYEVNSELVTFISEKLVGCVNLYPYNSGHVMLYPKRHITDLRELDELEEKEIIFFTKIMLSILDELYRPSGYNVGFNIGEFAGASIDHIHLHIIPRFKNELGLIDLIGGAKVLIEDPLETVKKIKEKLNVYLKDGKFKAYNIDIIN